MLSDKMKKSKLYLNIIKSPNKIKLIILSFLFLIQFFFSKILFNYFNNINNIKVCVCTLGKNENKYIREFVQHYEAYGIDKIFLYDNNDIDGERFENVINEYQTKGFVDILNWRGKKEQIYNIMNDCYKQNYKIYNWLIFYEIDEFIHLNNYSNAKNFLNEYKLNHVLSFI